jgi:hypothetical protein
MKSLKIQDTILNFDRKPITTPDKQILQIKDVIIQYLATFTGKDGKKIMRARKLGQLIYDAEEDPIEIEDADLDLIEEAMQEPQHSAIALAPVYEEIEEAKKEPEKTKGA